MKSHRHACLVRVLRLLQLLRTPQTLQWLATELEVSTRTVRRDLAALETAHIPILKSEATGRWQVDRRYNEDVA
jgi:predicted DNA-binding transcriptional regulator YafY